MSEEEPRAKKGWIRTRLAGISVATRIGSAVVIVSLLSLIVATIIGLQTGRDLGEELFDDQISSTRASGERDISAYLNSLEQTAEALAASPQAPIAVEQFSAAMAELDVDLLGDLDSVLTDLAEEYQEIYLDPLGEAGRSVDVRAVFNEENTEALYLQSNYSMDFEPLSSAAAVDDARDGSEWSETHSKVHPTYRRIANRLSLSDVLLVDTDTGQIVYTVQKRPDLGASVDVGPVSGSIVSTLVDKVRDNPDEPVQSADFRRYNPALLTPVAGTAAPILDEGELVGAIVLLYDTSQMTRLLTNDADWEAAELPTGGDVYLVGADFTTRSEPRGFLESPSEFVDASIASGQLSEDDRALVELAGTTVLEVAATDSTESAAEDGEVDAATRKSIDGRRVFSSVEQLTYDGYPLYLVAEVDATAAEENLNSFETLLIVGVAIYMVLLAFGSVAWSNSIMRPVRSLSDRLAVGAPESDAPINVPERSPIEFHRLAARFEAMALTLRLQHRQVHDARTERLGLMKRMLPSAVADRLAAGDPLSLDEAPDASVAVITLNGLTAISADEHRTNPDAGNDLRTALEELIGDLDGLARDHGLEPIKVIGDEYYAAVGHERPYIDHAPRAISFVTDAFDLLHDAQHERLTAIELAAGVASGPVAVGLTGTSGLVYDVWGITVRRADELARRAGSGRLLAADETAAKLPDSVHVEQVEMITGQMAWSVSLDQGGEPQ